MAVTPYNCRTGYTKSYSKSTPMDTKIFSARLKALQGNISGLKMASYLDIPQPLLSRYLRGITVPGADTIRKICIVYGCSADWLLGLSDERFRPGSVHDGGAGAPPVAGADTASELASLRVQLDAMPRMLEQVLAQLRAGRGG